MSARVADCKKIAVLRANALGDFVFALPALAALRAAYPSSEIVLIGRRWHEAFLAERPGPIDRVVVLPWDDGQGDPLERAPADALAFFRGLAAERFDIALQMHGGGGNSNPCVGAMDARVTAGSRDRRAARLDRTIPYERFRSEVLRCLEIAGLVGAAPVGLAPRLAVTDSDRDEAAALVPVDERPIVVLHPGARDERRWWPAARFAVVGDALAGDGARVLVNGDASERALVDDVITRMHAPALDVGALSLRGLAGLMSRAAVVVSNDSGPLHLAMAVGARTVGIYWCGNAIIAAPPLVRDCAVHIAWQSRCPVCGTACFDAPCPHRESCVAEIQTHDVVVSARGLLQDACAASTPPPPKAREKRRVQIAVVRALHLGDVLCAVPALRALRRSFPSAQITLVGLSWTTQLHRRFSRYLDDVIAVPRFPGLPETDRETARLLPFLAEVRGRRFDLALQMHGDGSASNDLVALLGAARTAGFHPRGAPSPAAGAFIPWDDDVHEIRRLLALLAHLGVPPAGEELELPIDDDDERLLMERVRLPAVFACVHPGARRADRRWPAKRFSGVVDALLQRGVAVVLTGSAAEVEVTREVAAGARGPVLDTAALDLPLGALAALVRRARLVVSNDTGVAHIAAALQVPSVVVFNGADPKRWAPLDKELHTTILAADATLARVAAAAVSLLERS